MKLDNFTLEVLKNFSTINQSIYITKGNVLRTISPTKTLTGKATVKQHFDVPFAIYDLNNFLSALSLFKNPELEFNDDKSAVIRDETSNKKINYVFAAPETIIAAPEKDLVLPNIKSTFVLKEEAFTSAMKALGILALPEIVFVGNGSTISIQANDNKRQLVSNYSDIIGETDSNFKLYVLAENLKMIPKDYVVNISSIGCLQFVSDTLEYIVVVESHSEMK
jgi:hypothetical protein